MIFGTYILLTLFVGLVLYLFWCIAQLTYNSIQKDPYPYQYKDGKAHQIYRCPDCGKYESIVYYMVTGRMCMYCGSGRVQDVLAVWKGGPTIGLITFGPGKFVEL